MNTTGDCMWMRLMGSMLALACCCAVAARAEAPANARTEARAILERIVAGQGTYEDLDTIFDLSEAMTGKTICVLSDSCGAPVVSGIQKFRPDFEAYLSGARAPVLVGV